MARDLEKYLKDVSLIKRVLREQEDRVLLRPWAFFVWAGVTALGTALSTYLFRHAGWSGQDVAWRIWPAVVLMGGVFEAAGWLQYIRREDRVIATSAHIKLLLSFCGVITASCVVAFSLVAQGADISAVVLLLLAVSLFTLAVFLTCGLHTQRVMKRRNG